MCETFNEAEIEEPNWQEVSSKLGLVLYGHVSSADLYQAWRKRGPSWMTLFEALQKVDGYQQVAKQVKKKAGVYDHVIFNKVLTLFDYAFGKLSSLCFHAEKHSVL